MNWIRASRGWALEMASMESDMQREVNKSMERLMEKVQRLNEVFAPMSEMVLDPEKDEKYYTKWLPPLPVIDSQIKKIRDTNSDVSAWLEKNKGILGDTGLN